jgi:hypothetical protein
MHNLLISWPALVHHIGKISLSTPPLWRHLWDCWHIKLWPENFRKQILQDLLSYMNVKSTDTNLHDNNISKGPAKCNQRRSSLNLPHFNISFPSFLGEGSFP